MKFMLISLMIISNAFAYPIRPDNRLTPGDLCLESDPDFKELRYADRIPYCKRSVSSSRKRTIYSDYTIPKSERTNYTIDHLIPLSLGGSNSIYNLWPQNKKIHTGKIEQELFWKVKKGELTVNEAIRHLLKIKLVKSSNIPF